MLGISGEQRTSIPADSAPRRQRDAAATRCASPAPPPAMLLQAGAVALPLLGGVLSSLPVPAAVKSGGWYNNIKKPKWTPPVRWGINRMIAMRRAGRWGEGEESDQCA